MRIKNATPEQDRQMVAAYQAGASASQAAYEIGRGGDSCIRALRRAGVALRPRCEIKVIGHSGRPRLFTVDELTFLADEYAGGASVVELCRPLRATNKTIKAALLALGVPLRTKAEVYQKSRIPCDDGFFSRIDTEEKAYWLGFLAADGCIDEARGALQITLARRDMGHLVKLVKALNSQGAVRESGYTKNGRFYPTCVVAFGSPRLVADLRPLGIIPRKSLIATPWQGPPELMRHYWRGVVDGDGCIHHRKDGYWAVFLCGSRAIVHGFADFVQERTGHMGGKPRQVKNIFTLTYGGTGLPVILANLLYGEASAYLDRKYALAVELMAVQPSVTFGSRRDWSHLTRELLLGLYAERGSWGAVARHLGLRRCNLQRTRHKLGLVG